jgi:hypothetical protein
MPKVLKINVDCPETFAMVNRLRDLAEVPEEEPTDKVKDIYLAEANSRQVQRGYVLTLAEMQAVFKMFNITWA